MTPPAAHRATLCEDMLPDCASEFGEIRSKLRAHGEMLARIEQGIETLASWRAGMTGAATERDRLIRAGWALIVLMLMVVTSSVSAVVISYLLLRVQ